MEIEKSGSLDLRPAGQVFRALALARAFGVLYFKGLDGRNVFVIIKRGLAEHASGEAGAGDEALKTVMSWLEGEYRFIEDVQPDTEDFPANVSRALAAAVAGVGADAPAEPPTAAPPPPAKVPALPVLPAGEEAGVVEAGTAAELAAALQAEGFTGACVLGPAGSRRGFFLFNGGSPLGGLLWAGDRLARGEQAEAAFADAAAGAPCAKLALGADEVAALAAGLTGRVAITRMSASALNVEEYLAWAADAKLTGVISVLADERAANILLREGRVIGAVTAPDTALRREPDEALALLFTPGATVEVYAARGSK